MARRPAPAPRPPVWHRSRLGWVNALGFALTLFLAIWLLMAAFANLLPKAEPLRFGLPLPFVLVLGLAQLATISLGAIVVLGFMARGADLDEHRPRLFIFWWTLAGLLFFLVDFVSLLRFGVADLPNAARWAEEIYWGSAPVGLLCFGLMTYVNVDVGGHAEGEDEDEAEEYEHDPDYEDAGTGDAHA